MNRATACKRRFWVLSAMILGFACAVMFPGRLRAQDLEQGPAECQGGLTYVIAFPDTVTNTFDTRFPNQLKDAYQLLIYSAIDNNRVRIGPGGGASQTKNLKAGRFEVFDLKANMVVTENGVLSNNTYRVEAEYPVVIYCYYATKFGGEAFTAIPVEAWGTDYYAGAHPGEVLKDLSPGGEFNFNQSPKAGPGDILVIAAFDETHVTFYPNGQLEGFPQTVNVELKANQAYQIQSYVDTTTANFGAPQPDLGGTYIFADKPIGVISGITKAQLVTSDVGLGQNSFKNSAYEWMPPRDQHGKKFVYLPSWDAFRPTGEPNEKVEEKRQAEFIRVYGTAENYKVQGFRTDGTSGAKENFTIPVRGGDEGLNLYQIRQGVPVPLYFETDTAAMAMMTTSAVIKFNGTQIYWGSYVGASYDASATIFMVEMTPREQWTNFAPFYAPQQPNNMNHYINVVTDTASKNKLRYKIGPPGTGAEQLFVMNRGNIPGTDLNWGTMQLVAGNDYYIRGIDESVKFYGFVYGQFKGYELYRPGKTRKGDPKASTASAGGGKGGKEVLHPSEYEENHALAYGYPLAPARCVIGPPDSLEIITEQDCQVLNVKVRTLSDRPVGLKTITLEKGSVNSKLVFLDPNRGDLILRKTKAEFEVRPINPYLDAEATVVITDRTGKKTRIPYKYFAERLDLDPKDVVDFGEVTLNDISDEKTIKICNPLGRTLTIKEIGFVLGNQRFDLINKNSLPITLDPQQCVEVAVTVTPNIENKLYEDSLYVNTECGKFGVKLRAETVKPCLYVDDLNFQNFNLADPNSANGRILPLKICNNGRGNIKFQDPWLTWPTSDFTVEQVEVDKLKGQSGQGLVLGPNECVTIFAKFTPKTTGAFRITARFWANTRECRDTSVWIATVTQPGPQIRGYDWQKRWVTITNNCGADADADPNDPKTKSNTKQYETVVPVWNTGNTAFRVDNIEIVGRDAKYFALDNGDPATTIRPGDQVQPAAGGDTPYVYQKVLFFPKDERAYEAEVVLTTDAGVVRDFLLGVGIEEHVSIGDFNFGRHEYKGAGSVKVQGTIELCGPKSTKDLEVFDLRLRNGDVGEFRILGPQPPYTLKQDECVTINVEFEPTKPGAALSEIEAVGNFSRCDDSVGVLQGTTYTNGVTARGYDFGDKLTCDGGDGTVQVENTGQTPVVVNQGIINDPTGYFQFNFASMPDTLQPGETRTYDVRFAPTTVGDFKSTVTFEVMDSTGQTLLSVQPAPVDVIGKSHVVVAHAHINKDYVRYPGSRLVIPVELDDTNLDEVGVTTIYFDITWDKGMMTLRGAVDLKGTLLDGWSVNIIEQKPGYYVAQFTAPAGQVLKGKGTLMNLPYLTFLGESLKSDLPFTITLLGKPCATVVTDPGAARIDSVCGLNFRLIEATTSSYALDQNSPNPFNPTTDITFSVGLDGQTSLVVYNALGEKVATLVSEHLQPGKYTVTWDASAQPSGLYYYQLTSGHWSKTETMILRK